MNVARKRRRTMGSEDDCFEEVSDGDTRRSTGQLCDICSKVDCYAIFDEDNREEQQLPELRQMCQNNCTLCKLIVGVTKSALNDEKPLHDRYVSQSLDSRVDIRSAIPRILSGSCISIGVSCVIRARWAHPSLYLNRRTAGPRYTQARVDFAFEADESPHEPFWIHLDRYRPIEDLVTSMNASVMLRQPLSSRPFNVSRLQGWLRKSEHLDATAKENLSTKVQSQSLFENATFRVIDVYTGELVSPHESGKYCALSYVWGKAMERCRKSCVSPFSSARPRANLENAPRTIQDAAKLVRALHQRYLWVDYLCIDQLNPADVFANISQMNRIYASAYLTIVAASGADADAGLTRLAETQNNDETPVTVAQGSSSTLLLPARGSLEDALSQTVWGSRAWTYQERALSPRCVFFTEEEVFFHCRTFDEREAYTMVSQQPTTSSSKPLSYRRRGSLSMYDLLSDQTTLTYSHYHEAVRAYTQRNLSYPGDRLDAFSGIVERFLPKDLHPTDKRALSGLVLDNFRECLRWGFGTPRASEPERDRIRRDARGSRCLPSWSWVGWTGGVYLHTSSFPTPREPVQILDAENIVCNLAGSEWKEAFRTYPSRILPRPVTLHVWDWTIPCRLQRQDDQDGAEEWCMILSGDNEMSAAGLDILYAGLRAHCPLEPDVRLDHYLVSLSDRADELWLLIEARDDSFERLALLHSVTFIPAASWPERVAKISELAVEKYLRLQ